MSDSSVLQDGSQSHPYLIENADDFVAFINAINTGTQFNDIYHKITNNIDVQGITFVTNLIESNSKYHGHLDGNYKVVSNFSRIGGNGGLFATSDEVAGISIKRLGLENVYISNQSASIFGNFFGNIDECYVTGTIIRTAGNYSGAFTGITHTKITNCYSDVAMSGGAARTGGIMAQVGANGLLKNCLAIGNINAGSGVAGGITGEAMANDRIVNCVAAMSSLSSSTATVMGRIVSVSNTRTVVNCYGLDTMQVKGATVSSVNALNYNGANATIQQLKSLAFYRDVLGWDMENIWTISGGGAEFPKLKGFL